MRRITLPRILSILLILTILFGCNFLTSDSTTSDTEGQETPQTEETSAPEDDIEPTEANTQVQPDSNNGGDTWTVLMYEDGDDEVLEEDTYYDVNEAERVGSTDKVNILAQFDRYKGGFRGNTNWTTAKRFRLTKDNDFETITSKELADLGEVNMAESKTLSDFVIWGIKNYPADHYALILADHGAGWPGGWSDADTGKDDNTPNTPLGDSYGDMLFLDEMDGTFRRIQQETGIEKLDFIGFDACLMAQLEVMTAIEPYAKYTVFSEETEPSIGWAYAAFLGDLVKNPAMSGADLSKSIVSSYIEKDQMVVDDKARAKYVERAYGDYKMTAAEVAREEIKPITLTAVDLAAAAELNQALDQLAVAMTGMPTKPIAASRKYALSFENLFSDISPSGDPYIDLGSFVKVLQKQSGATPEVKAAGNQVIAALKKAIIAEKHGSQKKGAMGLAIYFPNAKLFKDSMAGYDSYVSTAKRFAEMTLWDDFLTYYFTGQPIEQNQNGPKSGAITIAPGAGQVQMSIAPLELSAETASTGNPVTVHTVITGDAIGYAYVFTGRYSETGDEVQVVDVDYLDSETTRDVEGQIYPDWGEEGQVTIDYDWEPVMYEISDGTDSALAVLWPDTFGATSDDTLYTVDGYYRAVDSEEKHYARLYFDGNGNLVNVQVFSGEDDQGPMSEVLPNQGDQFTILEDWIDLNTEESDMIQKEGATLTFNNASLSWTDVEAPAGDYLVGIMGEDLEGNLVEEYSPVTAE